MLRDPLVPTGSRSCTPDLGSPLSCQRLIDAVVVRGASESNMSDFADIVTFFADLFIDVTRRSGYVPQSVSQLPLPA